MKDIVIIANFCRDFSDNDNGRFLYIAKKFLENDGVKVEIITSSFSHTKKKQKEELKTQWPFKVTFLYEPGYSKNVCLKRFYSHKVWGDNVQEYLEQRKKPDVVYCAVPSLTAASNAADYCKDNNVKFIIDVQDLWPEAFRMAFNIPVFRDIAFYPFKRLANKIYSSADVVVGVSESYVARVLSVNKKCRDGIAVFLGTDLSTFDANARVNLITDKNPKELWLGYCGTLGTSYDIKTVIDALVLLREKQVTVPKFIVMGDGPKKIEFEKYAIDKGVEAVFTGRLAYDKMCGLLKACDIVVNPIVGASIASIINKHADYAASGLPVLNTQLSSEYRKLVDEYKMGFNCNNRDPEDLAQNMSALIQNNGLRIAYGNNARKCAEEKFDRKNSYEKIIKAILE